MKRLAVFLLILLSAQSAVAIAGTGGIGPVSDIETENVAYLILSTTTADAHGVYTVEVIDGEGHRLILKVTADQIVDIGYGRYGVTSDVRVLGL
jgi:hypothetical protein